MSHLALAPVGRVPEAHVRDLAAGLRSGLGIDVRPGPALEEPAGAFDAARGQWSGPAVLKALLAQAPPLPARLIGVIDRDLFVPVLSFVYGQAQLGGRVGVVSLARLRPEFLGLPPDPERLRRRVLTEAVHELGHLLGLAHCPDRRCPMVLSVGLEEVDAKGAVPCGGCAVLMKEGLAMLGREGSHPQAQGGRS